MKVSQREKIVSIAAAVIVALFVLDSFALTPWLGRLSDANAGISEQQQWITQADQAKVGSDHASKRWLEMSKQEMKADAPAAESQILNAARQWAQSAGLTLSVLKPERSEKEQGFMKITIRVIADGATSKVTMSQITRFIYAIQTSDIPARISDLQISAHKEGGDDLTMSIGIATIYQPAPTTQAATEATR